jgi:hypothetical protein
MAKKIKTRSQLNYRYLFRTLTREQKAALFALVASTALGLIFTLKTPGVTVLYVTFVVSVTVTLFFYMISRYHFENDMRRALDDPENEDLRYLGNSRDGFEWFRKNSHGLVEVFNTVYRPRTSHRREVQAEYDVYFAAIRRAITPHCVWRDLVCPSIDVSTLPHQEFINSLSAEQKAGYEAKQIEGAEVPLLQITVLKFADDSMKASLGYGFPHSKELMVFVTSNRDTVAFLETYFMSLYDCPNAKWLHRREDAVQPAPALPASRFQRLKNAVSRTLGRPEL